MQTFSLQKIFDFVLDIIFPAKCVICGKLDALFCDSCRSKIVFQKKQNCPFCSRLMPRGRVCANCRHKSYLTGVMVVAHFEEPLKSVIYEYKYNFVKALSSDLAEVSWPYLDDLGERFLLTFVPSDKKRFLWRGYNQAEEVANLLAKTSSGVLRKDLIFRRKFKVPQAALSKKERLKNVRGAFVVNKKADVEGKRVVIVDDLIMTGSTLNACAKELKKHGAKEIWGFVLAKQP